jgi:nucleotide-binding universal stress UspA family protein
MVYMYQVLMPVDDDVDRAVAQAEYVIGLPGNPDDIEVTVVHAFRDDESVTDDSPPEQSRAVTEAMSHLEEAGVTVTFTEIYSPASDGILDTAADIEPAQIVMAGRDRSPTGKVLFGSVTQRVILNASIPVTVAAAEA